MFLDIIRNAVSYGIFFLYCALIVLPFFALAYLSTSFVWFKLMYCAIIKLTGRVLMFATFLPVTYQGVNELPLGPVIFVANHQSTLDIPLIASVVGSRECFWLAKSELFEYPLFNYLLLKSAIPVYPRNAENYHLRGAVKAAVEKLQTGASVILFPEGGRYVDGTIHPFFTGCAAMAKLSGAPVVPLFISGTGIALPPRARFIKRYPLMITIGKPFVCGQEESVSAFKERIENWFIELNWRRNYLLDHYGIRICNTNFDRVENGMLSRQA